MARWQEQVAPFVHNLENRIDDLKYRLYYRLGGPEPMIILPYRGYGTPNRLYLRGRVLEDPGVRLADATDDLWDNLVNMFRRFESDEIPHARLAARYGGQEVELESNEEGYFEATIDLAQPVTNAELIQKVSLELRWPRSAEQAGPVRTEGEVYLPPITARYAVISDIDDTVIQSDVTHLIKMARTVFLGNARTRLPFPGVAALYRALHTGASGSEGNPLFFVSSSPWNLYDLLMEFFALHEIPNPVLFLRDWGVTDAELLPTDNREHKLNVIRRILETYPSLPFLLIGDTSQQDPEIYATIVKEFPNRVLAVYIRNVNRDLDRPAAVRKLGERVVQQGSALVLADDSLAIAQHAYEKGLIAAEAFPDIHVEKAKDTAPPTALEKILSQPPKSEGETVRVQEPTPGETQAAVQEGAVESALKETGDAKTTATPTVIVEPEQPHAPLQPPPQAPPQPPAPADPPDGDPRRR